MNLQVPIVGQEQMQVLQAAVVITPALLKKLESWSKDSGIPFNELGQLIFRMGLIGLSLAIDEKPLAGDSAAKCIPLTDNEKKVKLN